MNKISESVCASPANSNDINWSRQHQWKESKRFSCKLFVYSKAPTIWPAWFVERARWYWLGVCFYSCCTSLHCSRQLKRDSIHLIYWEFPGYVHWSLLQPVFLWPNFTLHWIFFISPVNRTLETVIYVVHTRNCLSNTIQIKEAIRKNSFWFPKHMQRK